MRWLGIEFAPLYVPMERRIQTLCAATLTVWFVYGGPFSFMLSVYLIVFTKLRWLMLLYVAWIIWDIRTPENGGRRSRWVNSLRFWRYLKDYYPSKMLKVEDLELEPKKNYLFVHFPHGYVGSGSLAAYASKFCQFRKLFPHHTRHLATLNIMFRIPFYREFMLAIRGISCSGRSLSHVLGHPGGGNVAVLLPGGAAETYYCFPRRYDLVLKNRKGFIRLAMKNGVSIIPSFGFGETDLFTICDISRVPVLCTIAVFIKKYLGISPLVANGRGFFQYNYGLIPRRKPVTVLIGSEFKIEKNLNPTDAEVNEAHGRFLEHLYKLFEDHKHDYIEDAEDLHLVYK